jgi:hypothetical protein
MLSTLTWTGNGGSDSFNDPLNWSVTAGDDLNATRVPTSSDDVIINAASNRMKVQVSSGTASINRISSTDGIGKPFEVTGGTLVIGAASIFQNTLALSSGIISGNGVVTVKGAMIWSGGTIMDSDSAISTIFNVDGGLTLSGSTKNLTGRTLQVNSNAVWSAGTLALSNSTINNAPGCQFDIQGGNLTMTTSASTQFNNSGTVARSIAINTATIAVPFTNTATGTINVRSGTLKLSAPPGNLNSGVLAGGTYILNGTLLLPSSANITTNAASIILDGSNAMILAGSPIALANFATNSSNGSLTLENGADFNISGPFSNAGTFAVQDSTTFSTGGAFTNTGSVTIGNASTLSVGGGNYTQSAGSTKLTDSTSVLAVTGLADIQAGSISGFGKIQGSLTSNGQLSPGNSPGQLTVTGNYTQGPAAAMNIEIGGLTPGSQADQLVVNGSLALAGGLNVSMINGYVPVAGDKFRIVSKTSFGAISGTFAGLPEGATFKVGQVPFQITYLADLNNNNVELTVLPPAVSVDSVAQSEGDSGATTFDIPVRLSFKSNKTASVTVHTSDGSANAPADYAAITNQVVTFNPGETLKTLTVQVSGDTIKEPDETFTVNLSDVTDSATITASQFVETILNDDTLPAVSIADASLTEGDAGETALHFTISLTAGASAAVSGTFSTINGSAVAGADFLAQTAAAWSIPAGQTTATIDVPIHGDFLIEGTETFTVSLADLVNGLAGRMTATGTINDNDSRFIVISDPVSSVEGDAATKDLSFTVSVNQARDDGPITGTFSTIGGTATGDIDFVSRNNTAWSIAPGQTSTIVTVPIIGDFLIESTETFTVSVANVVGADPSPAAGSDTSATGTILDDDSRVATIADAQLAEGDSGTQNMTFTIRVNQARSEGPVSGTFATASGTATSDADFTSQTNVAWMIPQGQTSTTVTVPIIGDALIEGPETFTVTLANVTGADTTPAVGGDPTALGTILDDDHPQLSISDASVAEGNLTGDDKQLTFTIMLSQTIAEDVTVNVSTKDGSAVQGEDFLGLSNLLVTIPGNQASATIHVAVVEDFRIEPDEQFSINLSSPSANALLDPAHSAAIGTILNDDNRMLSISSTANALEGDAAVGDSRLTFTVTLSQAIPEDVTVLVDTKDAIATANQDYVPQSGLVITIPANQTAATFQVTIIGDRVAEGDETLGVSLRSASPNARIDPGHSTGLGTIIDDDFLLFSIDDVGRPEGNLGTTTFSFTVSLAAIPLSPVSVSVNSVDGTATTADNDYSPLSGLVLTFAPGDSLAQQVSLIVQGDTKFEQAQTFTVKLSSPTGGATITNSQGLGTILNDDNRPTISVGDRSVAEANDSFSDVLFDVMLSNPSDETVTVRLDTADGTATTADDDYVAVVNRLLSFAPGSTQVETAVRIGGDTKFEPDETFNINLSTATNASSIADSQGLCTIQNDDSRPQISIADVVHTEGDSGLIAYVFTVSLSNASAEQVSLDFTTADGTAMAADGDYAEHSGMLTFAAGTTTLVQTISVDVHGDAKFEPDENLFMNLSNLVNAAPTGNDVQGIGVIQNDDSHPTVHIADISQSEGSGGETAFVFTVSLSNPSAEPVSLEFSTADSTASVADGDYTANNGTVTFAANTTTISQTITVVVHGDAKYERDEQFLLNLANPWNAAATGNDLQAVGAIINDDATPTISIDDVSNPEGSSGAAAFTFAVSLSNPSFETVTVTYQTADGILNAARASRDYSAVAPTVLTFNPGDTSRTITVLVDGDTFLEPDEIFFVNLSGASNASIAHPQGLGIIENDDPPGPPPLYPAAVKDDLQVGYLERGSWTSASGGFLGDVRTHPAGIGTSTAVWSLNLAAGRYQVFTTWTPAADRATNAPFAVYIDGVSQGPAAELNQQLAPDDGSFDNRLWKSLGVFDVVAGNIDVQLSDAANGRVVSDGVIAVPVSGGGSDLPPVDSGPTSPPLLSLDANNDGFIAPSDALIVINYLNSRSQTALGPSGLGGKFSIDVNADQHVAPLDALLIINAINSRSGRIGGEGEGEGMDAVFRELGANDPADNVLWQILSLDAPASRRRGR